MNSAVSAPAESSPSTTMPDAAVGNHRRSLQSLSEMSDAELADRITECGEKMLAADNLYRETGDLGCVGERDFWWLEERKALIERGRRPDVVAALEQAKGLA